MGQVILAGAGQNPARTAGIAAGLPLSLPSITINKVCLSGLNAIATADQLIRAGEAEIIVAGGMESMTNAPHLLPKSREGFKYGDVTLVDSMAYDALWDQSTAQAMGALTEDYNAAHTSLTREEQDAFAAASHQKAAAGVEERRVRRRGRPGLDPAAQGRPDRGLPGRGRPRRHHRRVTVRAPPGVPQGRHHHRRLRLADLRRRRRGRGDEQGQGRGARPGVAGRDRRPRHGRRPRLEPADAARQRDTKACAKEGITPADLDLVEFNEAFAAVGIDSTRALGLDESKVNVNGGAIALGHPVGMSGTRIVLHLALELKRRGGGVGVAALCGGGGQGDALIVRVPA